MAPAWPERRARDGAYEIGPAVLTCLGRFVRDRSGAVSIEYCLIAAFIFLIIIGAVGNVGANLVPLYQAAADGLR